MANHYQIECSKCKNLNDINDNVCSNCGISIPGTVNTRRALLKAEVTQLHQRYEHCKIELKANNLEEELDRLENGVVLKGKAIINSNFDFLWEWLMKQTLDYTSYRRQIIDKSRPVAKFENDVKRSTIDSILFGSNIDIIYSALSIDEMGLTSYGDAVTILKSQSIENRTSALETNSYLFVEWASKNGWTVNDPLPSGYMAVWEEKHKLAVAKLSMSLKKGISDAELCRLILTSFDDRSKDVFIELYIYGKIAPTAIEKIRLPDSLRVTTDVRKRLKLKELANKFKVEFY